MESWRHSSKKGMTILFKKIIFFLVLIMSILFSFQYFFTLFFNYNNVFKSSFNKNINNTDYNYVIIGSSRANQGINSELINSKSSLKGVNLGVNGSNLGDNYITLKNFYENQNQTDIILLQIDFSVHKNQSVTFTKARFLEKLSSLDNKSNFYNLLDQWNKLNVYLKFITYIKNNDFFISKFIWTALGYQKFNQSGSQLVSKKYLPNPKTIEEIDLSNSHFSYLDSISFIAKENNANLICITMPYTSRRLLKVNGIEFFYQKMSNYDYHDYSDFFTSDIFFYDDEHINAVGNAQITDEILFKLLKYDF